MEYEKYTNEYEFGGLNDNKKITTVFDRYQTKEIGGELYIEPVIEEGKCPALQEGYGINGQCLWVSLQKLHLETRNLNDIEAADALFLGAKKMYTRIISLATHTLRLISTWKKMRSTGI